MRAIELAMSAPWAMLPENLEQLLAIAAREHEPQALEAYGRRRADRGERLGVREGVGIIDISGPLFKRANLFVNYSGATSYEMVRKDLQAALDDPAVTSIILRVDSPGGEANGCDELARAIFDVRGKKPIVAYVSGMACSGAYWLAAACDRVVVSDAAIIGSIGVVLGVTDRRKADERAGISRVEFVSSQSPGKRPDVETDAGKARIQKMVDDLGAVFVSAVAKYRGVTTSTVIAKFGGGGVEIGANAVRAGMANEVGQFEAVLSSLKRGQVARPPQSAVLPSASVSRPPALPRAEMTIADYKVRRAAIAGCEGAKLLPKFAEALIENYEISIADTIRYLKIASDHTASIIAAATPRRSPQQMEKDYLQMRARAGSLGMEWHPDFCGDTFSTSGAAGWERAVAKANERFGKGGVVWPSDLALAADQTGRR